MEPKVKEFLVFSTALVMALVLYMLYRPKRPPSKLSMRGGNGGSSDDFPSQKSFSEAPETFQDGEAPAGAIELSVIFQFNGHSFEAYEVLGVPAGISLAEVEKAYQVALAEADEEGQEFIHFAYQAILQKRRSK